MATDMKPRVTQPVKVARTSVKKRERGLDQTERATEKKGNFIEQNLPMIIAESAFCPNNDY